ncbi:MAG: histidine--tRNA ligase [Actinomycetia bacterium]|nr:histidine--tRNA ligase [Actinomycetes bacterium]
MTYQAPTGTSDLLPEQASLWRLLQRQAEQVFTLYGYLPIETPSFEHLDVFARGIGVDTDVVGKEMFMVFSSQKIEDLTAGLQLKPKDNLALRPEQTAGVARAVVQHSLVAPGSSAIKLCYAGSMFRHERPQKGRLREFHQIGVECLGASEPTSDAELITMLMAVFQEFGIPAAAMRLLLNSMGDDQCRPAYRQQVREFIEAHADGLCPDCVRRANTNPLRAFDCKNPDCQAVLAAAPRITDCLCPQCAEHYQQVKLLLDELGCAYQEDPRLVRGLDYYTRTVFEVQVLDGLGSQNAIGGGGRYDKLLAEFGAASVPGLGFAIGFERVALALEAAAVATSALPVPLAYIAAVDAECRQAAFTLASRLRAAGLAVELDHQARSLKSQFKAADKSGAAWVLVLGPDELACGQATLRQMVSRVERRVALDQVVTALTDDSLEECRST